MKKKVPQKELESWQQMVSNLSNLPPEVKQEIDQEINEKYEGIGQIPDTKVYHYVIWAIIAAIVIPIVAYMGVAMVGDADAADSFPREFVAISTTVVGALVGLLAPQPGQNNAVS
ncbi:hypothetical protein KFE98_17625 [bacterium SCSIO 12741]|nr:hypothetical protein KFE98_17625 [bacterium SCSIO 12741]